MSFMQRFARKNGGDDIALAGNNILAEISREKTLYDDSGMQVVEGQERAARLLQESYAVETVDLKTVKKFGVQAPKAEIKLELPKAASKQLQLQIGEAFCEPAQSKIDPLALLRKAAPKLPSSALYLLCDAFGCAECLGPEVGDQQLALMQSEGRQRRVEQAVEDLASLKENLQKLEQIYLLPWALSRGGVVSEAMIEERWERLCCYPHFGLAFRKLFEKVVGPLPLLGGLTEVTPGLFAVYAEQAKLAHGVLTSARTYFYTPGLYYPIEELLKLLMKEFSKKWVSLDEKRLEVLFQGAKEFSVTLRSGTRVVEACTHRTRCKAFHPPQGNNSLS